MSFLWASKPVVPPLVPTDSVLPVHSWDDTILCRSSVIYDLIRVDDVLNAEKLQTSLAKLVSRDGWRKLTARVRQKANGKLDYHIPSTFDDGRIPFAFNHDHHETSITAHCLASRLPASCTSSSPEVMSLGEDMVELLWRPGDPRALQDFLYSDIPVMGLRVLTFTDATLVVLYWPHILLDGVARKPFLDAWSLVLQGRDEEVPPFPGALTDPLATLGAQPSETYKHIDKKFGAWGMVIWGLRYIVDKVRGSPAKEGRYTILPVAFVKSLHKAAMADLERCTSDDNRVPFLSEGDVVCAWWTRHIVRAQIPKNSQQTIALNNAFGLRRLLGDDLLPVHHAYISNAFTLVPVFMAARDLLSKPLGVVAAAIRRAYINLGTRAQVEALASLSRPAWDKGGMAMFGDPWMHMIVCTNWCKADLYSADFSGAIKSPQTGSGQAGRPSFIHVHAFTETSSMTDGYMFTGKDHAGNIWLYSDLRKDTWPVLEKALRDFVSSGVVNK